MIASLRAENFRNFREIDLFFHSPVNVFVGSNGQGKTNLLEGIFFLGNLRSFRTTQWKDMRRIGTQGFRLSAAVQIPGRTWEKKIVAEYFRTRSLSVDGMPVARSSEFIQFLRTIVFSPQDILIINGSSSCRRRFFDMFISGIDSRYFGALQNFHKALETRNKLLKNREHDPLLFSSYEGILAETGSFIVEMRKLHSTEVGRKTEEFVGKIKNQPIPFEIEYRYAQGTETKEGYFARLGKERHRDMEKGFTQIGPQQDDFDIRWNSRLLRTYGSTGQCRAAAICLKMAQLELSRKKNHGEHNIIALVDDVTGELDAGTREAFFDTIGHADQAFFTFTEAPAGPFFEKSQFYHVSDGIVRVE